MHICVSALETKPEFLLVDGNRFNPYLGIPHACIIKGDGKYASIAAASVLAKTARDEYMKYLEGNSQVMDGFQIRAIRPRHTKKRFNFKGSQNTIENLLH
jgi:ribonuclease HII